MKHRRPIVVVASKQSTEVTKHIHPLQRSSIGRDHSIRSGMEHGFKFTALNELLAVQTLLGVPVVAVEGTVGQVPAAKLAALQREGALLTDTDAVLGVASVEMLTHASRSAGSARAFRDGHFTSSRSRAGRRGTLAK